MTKRLTVGQLRAALAPFSDEVTLQVECYEEAGAQFAGYHIQRIDTQLPSLRDDIADASVLLYVGKKADR